MQKNDRSPFFVRLARGYYTRHKRKTHGTKKIILCAINGHMAKNWRRLEFETISFCADLTHDTNVFVPCVPPWHRHNGLCHDLYAVCHMCVVCNSAGTRHSRLSAVYPINYTGRRFCYMAYIYSERRGFGPRRAEQMGEGFTFRSTDHVMDEQMWTLRTVKSRPPATPPPPAGEQRRRRLRLLPLQ